MESHSPMKKDQDQADNSVYVRWPRTIKDKREVEEVLLGNDYTVKLPRQSGRHCLVVFSSLEDKLRNLKALKDQRIDGKSVVTRKVLPRLRKSSRKEIRKKISVPKTEPDVRISRTLFLTSIKCGVSTHEVREMLPGCTSVTFLKSYRKDFRSAMAKMETLQVSREYLEKKREWPVIKGIQLKLCPDTRSKRKKKEHNKKKSFIK